MTTAKQTAAPRHAASPTPRFDLGALLNSGRQMLSVRSDAWASAFGRMIGMNRQYLKFLDHRLECQRTLVDDLASTGNPAEVFGFWMRFVESAQKDYRAEFEKMSGLVADRSRQAAATAGQPFERAATVVASAGEVVEEEAA